MSALNATVYSSSFRVSFAMGCDHNLATIFGKIHHKKRTHHMAVFISGLMIIKHLLWRPSCANSPETDVPIILTKRYTGHVESWFQKFFGSRKTMLG